MSSPLEFCEVQSFAPVAAALLVSQRPQHPPILFFLWVPTLMPWSQEGRGQNMVCRLGKFELRRNVKAVTGGLSFKGKSGRNWAPASLPTALGIAAGGPGVCMPSVSYHYSTSIHSLSSDPSGYPGCREGQPRPETRAQAALPALPPQTGHSYREGSTQTLVLRATSPSGPGAQRYTQAADPGPSFPLSMSGVGLDLSSVGSKLRTVS